MFILTCSNLYLFIFKSLNIWPYNVVSLMDLIENILPKVSPWRRNTLDINIMLYGAKQLS